MADASTTGSDQGEAGYIPPGPPERVRRAAYLRLMRTAHPDRGGSDWLAARVNEARDVLLG